MNTDAAPLAWAGLWNPFSFTPNALLSSCGALAKALPPAWEQDFRATALSLGGGSGWVTLNLHAATGEVFTTWSGSHTQALAGR